ncbi:sugar phosphate isomerase/epimerase family protein [Paenibacillus yanchengensis]|uniref:Sugar phosphate isomerase/epimerase family protein n=1 Tax=Paenibacillus yanchengensis TaxID=2035833 RepID=A0ABW4YL81_9BACL
MLKGLSGAGLGKVSSNQHLIELAANHQFQAVDLDALSLINEMSGVQNAKYLLAKHDVAIGSIGLSVDWRSTEENFQAGLSKLAEQAEAAAALGCTSCCTYILPATNEPAALFMAKAIRRLKTCAQILGAYNVRLGLEFVGPHHLRTAWENSFIWSMEDTLEMIAAIGEPNVGLLLDAIHWYTNEGTIDDLLQLKAEQIVHVHINDAPDVKVEDVLDNGRLYPGEGVIDLVAFLQALQTIGYKGAIAQEILTAEAPTESAETLAERSGRLYKQLFEKARIS